ncbi:MAG TPA: glycerate kinase [Nocardioides sp.]|jgi:glycerate kinase
MTRVLVAPDKFKGSLSAVEVAEAVRRGLWAGAADTASLEVRCLPVADGGDGTLASAVAAGFELVPARATGPTGEPVGTGWARHGDTAVVEMADVSGLVRLPEGRLQPLTATSRGTGELIAQALDAGVDRIVLGIGGSACTDGGAGMLQALGIRLLDASGDELPPGGGALAAIDRLDPSELHPRLSDVEIVVACDVDNPLTGPTGAAATYGPQKGAGPDDVVALDRNLARFADLVAASCGRDDRDVPGAGAAGGVGFAAVSLMGARLQPGIDLMLDLLDFDRHVRGSDLVVIGEGSLDSQSLHGKAPVGVARRARAAGATVVAVCGVSSLEPDDLTGVGITAVHALADLEADPATSMREAARLLEELAATELVSHL